MQVRENILRGLRANDANRPGRDDTHQVSAEYIARLRAELRIMEADRVAAERAFDTQAGIGVLVALQARTDATTTTNNAIAADANESDDENATEPEDRSSLDFRMTQAQSAQAAITQQRRERLAQQAWEETQRQEAARAAEEAARLEQQSRRPQEMTLEQRQALSREELSNKFMETRMQRMGADRVTSRTTEHGQRQRKRGRRSGCCSSTGSMFVVVLMLSAAIETDVRAVAGLLDPARAVTALFLHTRSKREHHTAHQSISA